MRFLPLTPRGIGTLEVESLGSFIQRLAILHCVSLDVLLKLLVIENADTGAVTKKQLDRAYQKKRFFPNGFAFSSPSATTEFLIKLLQETYEKEWFSSLGLFRIYPAFQKFRGVFSHSLRWCPQCWRCDIVEQGIPYFRAYWGFQEVSHCRLHKRELLESCPECGTRFGASYRHHLHKCQKCGFDLSKAPAGLHPLSEELNLPFDLIDLLQCIQDDENWNAGIFVDRAKFSSMPKYFKDEIYFDNFRRRSIPKDVELFEPAEPTFVRLRRICNYYGIRLSDVISRKEVQHCFFFGPLPTAPADGLYPKIAKKSANLSKKRMLEKLKTLLQENAHSPKPVKFYAGQLHVSSDCLAHRYPRLYRRIVEHYEFYVRASRVLLEMKIDIVLELMFSEKELDRGVKKICQELMEIWGFPKNLSREHVKKFRDEVLSAVKGEAV
jgi:hypothetical protein